MASYEIPVVSKSTQAQEEADPADRQRRPALSANQKCWPEQAKMESALKDVIEKMGYELVRAHPYKEEQGHGFIQSQKEGMEVFAHDRSQGAAHRRRIASGNIRITCCTA